MQSSSPHYQPRPLGLACLGLFFLLQQASGFSTAVSRHITTRSWVHVLSMEKGNESQISRKGFVTGLVGSIGGSFLAAPGIASAIPMVTSDEFDIILKDSPLSIKVVEFSGPKSETITVRLVDSTTFGIKDVIESAMDPRSPLKVAASCRKNGVPTQFVDLQSLLDSTSSAKKKKYYTNARVQEAAEKTKLQEARIAQDEEDRLDALRRQEGGKGGK